MMSVRRKSTVSHVLNISRSRASLVSLYSAISNLHYDYQRSFSSRCLSRFVISKIDIYHVLERQEGTRTLAYHLFVFCLTLISLVFGSISTIDEWRSTLDRPLYYGELILCIFFACELLIRIWSAGCLIKYRTLFGRIKFIFRPVIFIDILTLFGFTLSLITGVQKQEFPSLTLKFLPPLQMIRFLRIDRQLTSWKILKGIIISHRQELTVTLVIAFMFLITGSYLVYIAETPIDPNLNTRSFRSLADTMWFSIITMTTIGFGDLYPTTYVAKMITTTICFLGVAFWCLPAGIIGSGLAIKVQEKKRDEAFNRLVPAAASLIGSWWRYRCAYQGNRYISTWQIYTLIQRRVHTSSTSKQAPDSAPPAIETNTRTDRNPFRFPFTNNQVPINHSNDIRTKSINCMEDLPKRYVTAIKILRMMKYSASSKKYQQAKRPIDLKDVVTENTQMNNRLSIMLNDIQRRLDAILGTSKLASFLSDEQKRQLSLVARIEQVEEKVFQFEAKLNHLEKLALALIENT